MAKEIAPIAVPSVTGVSNLRTGSNARDIVAIPMGEVRPGGTHLAVRAGSALAYAAVEQATAPGQLSLDAMMHLYRAGRSRAGLASTGVIGNTDRAFTLAAAAQHGIPRAQRRCHFVPFLVREPE